MELKDIIARHKNLLEPCLLNAYLGITIKGIKKNDRFSDENIDRKDLKRKVIESNVTDLMRELFKYAGSDPEKFRLLENDIKNKFPECIIPLSKEDDTHILDVLHCVYSLINPNDPIPIMTDSRINRDQIMRECNVVDCYPDFIGDCIEHRGFSYNDDIPFNNAQYFGFLTLQECIRLLMMYDSYEKRKDMGDIEKQMDQPTTGYLPFIYVESSREVDLDHKV